MAHNQARWYSSKMRDRIITLLSALVLLSGCTRTKENTPTLATAQAAQFAVQAAQVTPTPPPPQTLTVQTARLEPWAALPAGFENQSPFGIAASHWSGKTLGTWLPQVRDAGITWLRGFDVSALDDRLALAEREGVNVTGFLAWSPAGKPLSFPIKHLNEWSDYVTDLVSRGKGRVKYWEVWNEPPNFSEDTSPESYAKVVVVAYTAAKRVDPNVQVGLATKSNYVSWLETAIRAGAKNHFDYVTVHPYELMGMVAKGGEPLFLSVVPTMRAMLAAANPERKDVPIWITEVGQPVNNGLDANQQAITVVKAYVLGIAQGMTRIHWFEGRDGDSGPFGLLDGKGNPRVSYRALSALIDAVGKEPKYEGWLWIGHAGYGFVFSNDGKHVMVAWAPPDAHAKLEMSAEATVFDPLSSRSYNARSIPLTPAPLFVTGLSSSQVKEAQTNKSRPFPWNGDFSGAKSVTLEAPDVRRGIHQFTTPVIRWFDGQQARDASAQANQPFVVDPNFLAYQSVPLRISVTVRKNGSGRAGFNLKYESPTGWKTEKGGWYTVPDSNTFVTKDFVINDPQFVGNWGYHFMLDSDSRTYSNYSIQSITVTKL